MAQRSAHRRGSAVRLPCPTLGPARQAVEAHMAALQAEKRAEAAAWAERTAAEAAASDRALEDLRLQQRRVNAQLAARGPDLWHAAPPRRRSPRRLPGPIGRRTCAVTRYGGAPRKAVQHASSAPACGNAAPRCPAGCGRQALSPRVALGRHAGRFVARLRSAAAPHVTTAPDPGTVICAWATQAMLTAPPGPG